MSVDPGFIREHAVVLFRLPIADNIVSNERERNLLFGERCENIRRMCSAQDHATWAVRLGQDFRQAQTAERCVQIGAKGNEV